MNKVKIALLGFGNVGQGVWKILHTNQKEIIKRCGQEIELSRILVRDPHKKRLMEVPEGIITTCPEDILNDSSINIVVELMGGSEPAFDYMIAAMKKKKHVVTANKLVLATQGQELFKTAQEEGIHFYYEASVGGGIPIIREINESLTANRIDYLAGIINGTTNYILTKMTQDNMDFSSALKEAQDKGFAEADPTSDVEGFDAAYKLAIISSLSFGKKISYEDIYREGITRITAQDIAYAKKFGYTIKLLAMARRDNERLELKVNPAMIPSSHPMASVNDSYNAIFIKGNAVGSLMLYGRGAGDLPTGSAVVGDIISIIKNNADTNLYNPIAKDAPGNLLKPSSENLSGYYVRLDVKDQPGILGQIATILGDNYVSILTVTQDIVDKDHVSLVFITHDALQGNMMRSISSIKRLSGVNSVEGLIRIEKL